MNQQLSSLRSQLLDAQHQLPQLLEECLGREPLLPGSIYTLRRKRGKPNSVDSETMGKRGFGG